MMDRCGYYGGVLSQNDKGWLVNMELVMWDEAVRTLGDVEAENQLDVVVEAWVAAKGAEVSGHNVALLTCERHDVVAVALACVLVVGKEFPWLDQFFVVASTVFVLVVVGKEIPWLDQFVVVASTAVVLVVVEKEIQCLDRCVVEGSEDSLPVVGTSWWLGD